MVLFKLLDRGIGLVSTVVLARLLLPVDFGVVAMASSVIALAELLGSFSFDVALIQHKRARREQFDTAWTLNLLFALGCAGALALAAYPAAAFYSEPRLQPVILVLAAGTLVQGLENVGVVAFRKAHL
jgi:O-antigen/teichoic acid export membrane protein